MWEIGPSQNVGTCGILHGLPKSCMDRSGNFPFGVSQVYGQYVMMGVPIFVACFLGMSTSFLCTFR